MVIPFLDLGWGVVVHDQVAEAHSAEMLKSHCNAKLNDGFL